jgi:protein phosphatase
MVSDEDIGMALRDGGANLQPCARQLVQMANDNSGRDNVSVILIWVMSEYTAPHRFVMDKVFDWLK